MPTLSVVLEISGPWGSQVAVFPYPGEAAMRASVLPFVEAIQAQGESANILTEPGSPERYVREETADYIEADPDCDVREYATWADAKAAIDPDGYIEA